VFAGISSTQDAGQQQQQQQGQQPYLGSGLRVVPQQEWEGRLRQLLQQMPHAFVGGECVALQVTLHVLLQWFGLATGLIWQLLVSCGSCTCCPFCGACGACNRSPYNACARAQGSNTAMYLLCLTVTHQADKLVRVCCCVKTQPTIY
jgi:hypothetical protein